MTPAHPDPTPAFRALSARLTARRIASLGVRLWFVLAVLAACVAAFTYWRVRVPLDGVTRHDGPLAATASLALTLAGCALAGGVLAAARQTALAAAPPGPEWLALPVPPAAVERHLGREARLPALAVFVPAAAAWLAGVGLVPVLMLGALALAFPIAWWLVARLACLVAWRRAASATGPARTLPVATRVLVSAPRPARIARVAAARFRSEPAWRALARLDRSVSLRAGSPRARLVLALLALAASIAVWFVSHRHPLETRALSFAGFTLACAGLGAWAAWRAAGDPAAAIRPLPLSLADAWRARALPLFALLTLALLLQAAVALPLPAVARIGLVVTWLVPGLLVTLIGLHLGLSLPGSPVAAENLYYSWLGVGVLSSLAIPLFGWGMLIGAFVFATRRMRRWYTPEVV
jgi:hypothetical protein